MINLFSPARTVLLYTLLGCLWIYISDATLSYTAAHPETHDLTEWMLHRKGYLFVLATAAILYILLRRYAKNLRDSELAYLKIFRESPQPMYIFDKETFHFIEVNDATVNVYGYTRDEFLRMTILEIRPPEDIERVKEVIGQLKEGAAKGGTWRHLKKNGELVYVNIETFTTFYKGKRVQVASAWDITDQHLADMALKEQQELNRAIINSTQDLIWAVDDQKNFIAFNESFYNTIKAVVGVELKIGSSTSVMQNDVKFPRWQEFYNRALSGKHQVIEEGHELEGIGVSYAEITFNPIITNGKITGVACFARDITRRKETEIRLLEVAHLSSHALRRPVASMLGVVALLDKDNPCNPENLQIVSFMDKIAKEMDVTLHKVADKCNSIFRDTKAVDKI